MNLILQVKLFDKIIKKCSFHLFALLDHMLFIQLVYLVFIKLFVNQKIAHQLRSKFGYSKDFDTSDPWTQVTGHAKSIIQNNFP